MRQCCANSAAFCGSDAIAGLVSKSAYGFLPSFCNEASTAATESGRKGGRAESTTQWSSTARNVMTSTGVIAVVIVIVIVIVVGLRSVVLLYMYGCSRNILKR